MSKYSKFQVGDKETITHKLTQKDIDKFVELSGDDNKLHVDKLFASRTSYKKPVAHGMIGASFISTIIGTKIPGDGALWYSQSIEFLLPVRVGDTLTITAEIIKKNDKQNSLELETNIINQHKQKVTTGIAKVKIIDVLEEDSFRTDNIKSIKKVALILGASGGIGTSVAKNLASENYSLVLHYNSNKEKILLLKKELEELTNNPIIVVKADLLNANDIKNMFCEISRHFENISSLINASMLNFGNIKFSEMEWDDISKQIDINIKASFLIMQNAIPLMEKQKYGKVVFLTTQATEQYGSEWLHYTTAKSALNGFAKSLAFELAKIGIRVNLVSPGMTDTELVSDIPEKVKLLTAAKTPLRRLARPQDVANAISYLISDKSDFLTGETLRVNGGQVMF